MFPRLPLLLIISLLTVGMGASSGRAERLGLEAEGLLVISAAQDTTAGFQWRPGPGPDRISLVWPEGHLSVPDSLGMQGDAHGDLGVPLQPGFGGSGPQGPLLLEDGVYPIKDSLALTDSRVQLMVSAGRLEISGNRLRYWRPEGSWGQDAEENQQEHLANLLMIAGLLLMIAILLRRARRKTRRPS